MEECEMDVAVLAVVTTVAVIMGYLVVGDRREFKEPPSDVFALKSKQYEPALKAGANGWFVKKLRCEIKSFLAVADLIKSKWTSVHRHVLHHNVRTDIRKCVAICLHFLAHGCVIHTTASIFGVLKSSAVDYINEVLPVITSLSSTVISSSTYQANLAYVSRQLELKYGFLGVVGAIGGTLVPIARLDRHEGWFCRKKLPCCQRASGCGSQPQVHDVFDSSGLCK